MKKILIVLTLLFYIPTFAQGESEDGHYRLYPTKNMWTFLKLDTRTGEIWQVQFSVNEAKFRYQVALSLENLAADGNSFNGRFTLYQTDNIYNLLLLDTYSGRIWQVQWGDAEYRQVIRIRKRR